MRTKLSRCLRKRRFNSAAEAVAFSRAAGLELRPYRCDRCRQFHLTRRTKGKWIGLSSARSGADGSGGASGRAFIGAGEEAAATSDCAGPSADALGAV
ncbi:hypothetical protein SPHI_09420 [Sphingomonas jeddahensis]|uniref:Uncharacterized protein n=1 Tax=Sphingomonas jeddahensis TaxID=1915074 RepID=A0A1V2EWT3_9SPHN|nr:hypothetical protein SPHI_09420 [Sphingomonas jeddahensis]